MINELSPEDLQRFLLDLGYTIHKGIGVLKDQSWSEEYFFIDDCLLNKANQAITLNFY